MAAEHLKTWKIGNVEVTRIVEVNNHIDPLDFLLEGGSPELMKQYDWLFPHFSTPEGEILISFQCFLLKAGDRHIMLDTCVGNGRWREHDIFNNLQTTFLEDLEQAGCLPEDIDTVLCTHMHFDHVGWNTMLVDGQWVPTFPNARYLIQRTEFDYIHDEAESDDVEQWLKDSNRDVMADSIKPVLKDGLVDLIDSRAAQHGGA